MTRAQLKTYLKTEATAAGIASTDIEARVEQALNIGLEAFWGMWDWYFKMKEVTYPVTETATNYDAPKDFGGLIKIVQQDTSFGGDLVYFAKEEFDRRFPKLDASGPGVPAAVTCYQSAGEWKLQFYPRPKLMDFNLVYEVNKVFAMETIPKNFTDGLVLSCAKYIPRLASNEGLNMENRMEIVFRRLLTQNSVHKKPINALGGQDVTNMRSPRWADPFAHVS